MGEVVRERWRRANPGKSEVHPEREEPVKILRAHVKGKPISHDFRIRGITRVRAHNEHWV